MDHKCEKIEWIARGLMLRDHEVLLCRSVKHHYYYLPGGHIEHGEPASVALRREFMEETGHDVHVGTCLLVQEHFFERKGTDVHEVNIVFHVTLRSDALSRISVSSLEPRIAFDWVALAGLNRVDLRPSAMREWLTTRCWESGMTFQTTSKHDPQ